MIAVSLEMSDEPILIANFMPTTNMYIKTGKKGHRPHGQSPPKDYG